MPDQDKSWNRDDTILAISHLARSQPIDHVVPLDDFDLEMAAALREHLRVSGMGETTTRYFRDKLAMRVKALDAGLNVPEFVHLLNDEKIRRFTETIPPPWVLKPRMLAGAIGISMVHNTAELRSLDEALGNQRSFPSRGAIHPGRCFPRGFDHVRG
jgi:biotin carboxylase